MEDVRQLKADLNRARQRASELQAEIEQAELEDKMKRQAPLRVAADKAHKLFCQYNHTNGCGWEYEGHDWHGREHQRWLDKIEKLVEHKYRPINIDELIVLLDELDSLNNKYEQLKQVLFDIMR
jgi:DNA repair exonuclease SbcCD ATPase subunit